MILRNETWQRIRPQFTEDEKRELSAAVTGEAICPRGLILDPRRLSTPVLDKLCVAITQRGATA